MSGPAAVTIALLGVALLCGCQSRETAESERGGMQGAVLVLLDTVRADHLSCQGSARPTTPALDELARRGVRFDQAISFSPWTLPSVATMLAARSEPRAFVDKRLTRSVVESIRRAGYRTAAITEGGYVSRSFGLDLGFDEFVEEEGAVQVLMDGGERPDPGHPAGGIENTFRRALEWIDAHRAERFFLMIHTYEAHVPYTRRTFVDGLAPRVLGETFPIELLDPLRRGEIVLGDEDLAYLAALYDGGIHECDRQIEMLLSHLESLGLRDRLLFVVTSDHGEELGEHFPSRAGDHGHSLHDNLLHVPLILDNPGECYPVRRVGAQVRLIDVLPTIADILGAAPQESIEGASLVPLMRGKQRGGRAAYGGSTRYGPRRVYIRQLGYKYIEALGPDREEPPLRPPIPRRQLYDLRADPAETRNLIDEQPDLATKLADLLAGISQSIVTEETFVVDEHLDGELRERLRSLGYVE